MFTAVSLLIRLRGNHRLESAWAVRRSSGAAGVALLFMTACPIPGTAEENACDFSIGDSWHAVEVANETDCDEGVNRYEENVTFLESGSQVTAEGEDFAITGVRSGCMIQLQGSEEEDEGRSYGSGVLQLSEDGKKMEGSGAWTWRDPEDPEATCSGTSQLTLTRGCRVNVTRLGQGDSPWGSVLYDTHRDKKILKARGCALTSLSMALNFQGIANDPGTLNQFMIENGGFTRGSSVIWPVTVEKFSNKTLKWKYIPRQINEEELSKLICDGHPVIVAVNISCDRGACHFVLATGAVGDEILITDPTARTPTPTKLSEYPDFEGRGYVYNVPSDMREIRSYVAGASGAEERRATISDDLSEIVISANNAGIMVTDERGRRTGFLLSHPDGLEEIPQSYWYVDAFQDDVTGEKPPLSEATSTVNIQEAVSGEYRISIVGRSPGTYSLQVTAFSRDGTLLKPVSIDGVTGENQEHEYELSFSNVPGSELQVTDVSVEIPRPVVNAGLIERYGTPAGRFVRYRLPVLNWQAYPAELFSPAPDLPPCGANANAARTWVDVHDAATDRRLYGFCAFRSPDNLQKVWFGVREGSKPPERVYVVLRDRRTGSVYRSEPVRLPAQIPSPIVSVGPVEHYETRVGRFVRYRLPVSNWQAYPAELFSPAPDLPACGANTNAARTWVDVHDAASDQRLYGFCAFRSPNDLRRVWFAVREGSRLPERVYVVLRDRRTGSSYRSKPVQLPRAS